MRAAGVLVQELVQVVGADTELPAEHVGRGGGGGQRDQALAALAEHVGQARIAVVFPDPAGPSPAASSVLRAANAVTRWRCPGSSAASGQRLVSVQRGGHRRAREPGGRGRGRGGQQPLLGVEDGLAGVPLGRRAR